MMKPHEMKSLIDSEAWKFICSRLDDMQKMIFHKWIDSTDLNEDLVLKGQAKNVVMLKELPRVLMEELASEVRHEQLDEDLHESGG